MFKKTIALFSNTSEKTKTKLGLLLVMSYMLLGLAGLGGLFIIESGRSSFLGLSFNFLIGIHKPMAACVLVLLAMHVYFHWNWLRNLFKYNRFRSFITLMMIIVNSSQLLGAMLIDVNPFGLNIAYLHSHFGLLVLTLMLIHLYNNRAWFKHLAAS